MCRSLTTTPAIGGGEVGSEVGGEGCDHVGRIAEHVGSRELEDDEAVVLELVPALRILRPVAIRDMPTAPADLDHGVPWRPLEVDARHGAAAAAVDNLAARAGKTHRADQPQEATFEVAVPARVQHQLVEQPYP